MRRRLEGIEPGQARRDADALAANLLDLPEVYGASDIFLCLSCGTEIDTWRLVDRLAERGARTYVPRVVLEDHTLHVHPFPCRLTSLSMGLRQPQAGEPELAEDEISARLDVALILGLGFDRRGLRLGHGAGFFDRFLARHPLNTIGIAYDEQIVDRLPQEDHDVPMNLVVTPSGVYNPRRAGSPASRDQIGPGTFADDPRR